MAIDILICPDFGSSLIKSICSVNFGKPFVYLMEPEVIEVPTASVKEKQKSGVITPGNDAWIKFRRSDEKCLAVGHLAQSLRATMQFGQLKYETAVTKLLAIIGAIVQQENLPTEDISLSISALLPLGEFSDKEKFESQLKSRLRSFYFRGTRVQAELSQFSANPEGGGFALNLLNRKGQQWFTSRDAICCLMLGHRNSSLLTFSHGRLDTQASSTTDLGFIQFVDKVIERTSGQNRRDLSRMLYEIGEDLSPQNRLLRSLAKSRDSSNIEAEISQLSKAISTARSEYWELIKNWIDEFLPRPIDALSIGGGAGYYLRHELQSHLDWADPYWDKPPEFVRDMAETLSDPSLNHRLVDAAYVFEHHRGNTHDRKEAA